MTKKIFQIQIAFILYGMLPGIVMGIMIGKRMADKWYAHHQRIPVGVCTWGGDIATVTCSIGYDKKTGSTR